MKVLKKQLNSHDCIICGVDNESGLKAPFYEMEDSTVVSKFIYRDIHQSYPGRTHGGMITCMLDELIGRVMWVKDPNVYGVTTSIDVKFRRPVAYNVRLKARAVMKLDTPRYFVAVGYIYDMQGNLLAEAEGKYLKLAANKIVSGNVSMETEMAYNIQDDVEEIDF